MALRHRDATGGRWNGQAGGEGQVVDVALTESVFNLLESTLMEYSYDGTVRQRTGTSIPGITPSNVYRSKGGEWVQISGNGDAIFKRLMLAIGRADMAEDPGLARNPGRMTRADEIDAASRRTFPSCPTSFLPKCNRCRRRTLRWKPCASSSTMASVRAARPTSSKRGRFPNDLKPP